MRKNNIRSWHDRKKYRKSNAVLTGIVIDLDNFEDAGGVGAKTKLTPEVLRIIIEHIIAGHYVKTACIAAGINKGTFYEWLEKGEAGRQPYATFLEAVNKAEALSQIALLESVKKEQGGARWLLSRRFYDDWGDKQKIETEGEQVIRVEFGDYEDD